VKRALDWTAVLFPLLVSIAANFAWAARDGDLVAIVAGIVTPILLVLAVERWHAHTGLVGWQHWARLVAMAVVTLVTAAVSWVHITALLIKHGWEWQLALVAPLGVDGLAVLGTLALWSVVRPDQRTETTETTETTPVQWSGPDTVELPRQPDTVPFEVEPEPEPRKLEPVGWSVDQIVADLRERGETDVDRRGFQRFVRDTYSVGPGKATKVIDTLKLQAVAS
jgi:hypothetical protein